MGALRCLLVMLVIAALGSVSEELRADLVLNDLYIEQDAPHLQQFLDDALKAVEAR